MPESFLNVSLKGANFVVNKIKQEKIKKDKAIKSAIKGEAFRLRKEITQRLRKADPGGQQLEERTTIARRRNDKWGNKKPFRGMTTSTRYDFNPATLEARIGWTAKSPTRLRRMAEKYQKGYSKDVTPAMRKYLATEGGKLSKRSKLRRFFFLKSTTTLMEIPERQIIGPIFKAEKGHIKQNIARNFRLKMAGKRF